MWLRLGFLSVTAALLTSCTSAEPEGMPTGAACDPQLSYAADVAPFMQRYCLPCHAASHAAADRRGAPLDHDFDSEQLVLENAEHIALEAAAGDLAINRNMPPRHASTRPTDAERQMLGSFLACINDGNGSPAHRH